MLDNITVIDETAENRGDFFLADEREPVSPVPQCRAIQPVMVIHHRE